MTEVLIIGASGLLGQHLLNEAEARRFSVTGTYHSEDVAGLERLDLMNHEAARAMIYANKPLVVILSAGMTSLYDCSREPEKAWQINARTPTSIANACKSLDTKLVYFSTSHVFDGSSLPLNETTPPEPLNVFGNTKFAGEQGVLSALPSSLVIRTGVDYGWNRLRPKENLVTTLIHRLRCSQEVALAKDQLIAPSYSRAVAKVVYRLLEKDASGLYHVASGESMTPFDLGIRVARAFHLQNQFIKPKASREIPNILKQSSRLDIRVSKVENLLGVSMDDTDTCLSDMKFNF